MSPTSWFRSWHGAPSDPKWRTVARKAGVRPGDVVAVVWELLDRASRSDDRGSIEGFSAEIIADTMGYDPDEVARIVDALREIGALEGDRFSTWDRYQPKREDPTSTERVRAFRAQGNAVQHTETSTAPLKQNGTQRNTVKRNETLEKIREETEKRREPTKVGSSEEGMPTFVGPTSTQASAELAASTKIEHEPKAAARRTRVRPHLVAFDPTKLPEPVFGLYCRIVMCRWTLDNVPEKSARESAEIAEWLVAERQATSEAFDRWLTWWWHDPDSIGAKHRTRPWPKNVKSTWDTALLARPAAGAQDPRFTQRELAAGAGVPLTPAQVQARAFRAEVREMREKLENGGQVDASRLLG